MSTLTLLSERLQEWMDEIRKSHPEVKYTASRGHDYFIVVALDHKKRKIFGYSSTLRANSLMECEVFQIPKDHFYELPPEIFIAYVIGDRSKPKDETPGAKPNNPKKNNAKDRHRS